MQRHTHREYKAWQVWLDNQWNDPNLTHYYLMQIAAEVRRVLSKKPRDILLSHFKLLFTREKPVTEEVKQEQKLFWSKSHWLGMLGLGKKLEAESDKSEM